MCIFYECANSTYSAGDSFPSPRQWDIMLRENPFQGVRSSHDFSGFLVVRSMIERSLRLRADWVAVISNHASSADGAMRLRMKPEIRPSISRASRSGNHLETTLLSGSSRVNGHMLRGLCTNCTGKLTDCGLLIQTPSRARSLDTADVPCPRGALAGPGLISHSLISMMNLTKF